MNLEQEIRKILPKEFGFPDLSVDEAVSQLVSLIEREKEAEAIRVIRGELTSKEIKHFELMAKELTKEDKDR